MFNWVEMGWFGWGRGLFGWEWRGLRLGGIRSGCVRWVGYGQVRLSDGLGIGLG